jgi:serine/threonine-protein kinase
MKSTNIPERFGKYQVSELLGRGAMGAVYRAFDPDIKRTVAIKTIRWDMLQDDGAGAQLGARFRNEAQAAGRMTHPGIVAVFEYGQSDECAFIAMEYVEGCDLREYFGRHTVFEEADVVSIMVQLLDALQHAHEHMVWHRDIKPANLIIMNDGRLKITDFGIARIETSEITQTFPLMGTNGYIAPEMYRGEPLDHRADLFAAGAVLYQLLAGRPAFAGAAEAVMHQVCHEQPAAMASSDQLYCYKHFDPVISRALAKRPEERYDSAGAFRAAVLAAHALPANAKVSDSTILATTGLPRRLPEAGDTSGPKGPSQSGSTRWPPGWDPATLDTVEHQLAHVVGPMARVLVQRAARRCGDVNTLINVLADNMPEVSERRAFLSIIATSSGKASAGRVPAAAAPPPQAEFRNSRIDAPAASVPPAELERVAAILSRFIGPLSRLVIKRAAQNATDPEQFYQQVAEGVPAPSDRDAFLRLVLAGRKAGP